MADNQFPWRHGTDGEPEEYPKEPDASISWFTPDFESDGHPDGYAVASGTPGLSGRWVSGATRADAMAAWIKLYLAGDLDEVAGA